LKLNDLAWFLLKKRDKFVPLSDYFQGENGGGLICSPSTFRMAHGVAGNAGAEVDVCL
jgi:hypothetical protein